MAFLEKTCNETRVNLGARVLVGRSPSCALRLDSPLVSGEHAVLWWADGKWWVRDLGSRNGTWLGGRRLQPGEAEGLEEGAHLSFGQREEVWALTDASGPTMLARNLAGGEPRAARDGLLCLPDETTPELTIFWDARGRWIAELEKEILEVHDGDVVEAGGARWQLSLPRGSISTLPATQEASAPLALRFSVSPDEEDVEVRVRQGGREHVLEPRVHHYMLLLLARARLQDQAGGVPEEGWVYTDTLMDMMRIDRVTMNLYVFRCRKHLAGLGIPAAGELVERRPHTRQLRIGTPLLEITSL